MGDEEMKEVIVMNEINIPYQAHESMIARLEIHNKRMWILNLILIILLVATNAGWLYYESQFIDVQTTIEAEQDGDSVNIIGLGDVDYNE